MSKQYARLIGPQQEEALQTAADDVGYLTAGGMTPTDAIVKVASAAGFPAPMTNLLIYAYSNGMSAEKRAADGGPFEKLGEFELPDPVEVHRRLYEVPKPDTKTASAESTLFPNGMRTFDRSLSDMDSGQVREWVGLPTMNKTAEQDFSSFPSVSVTRTTITMSGGEDGDTSNAPKDFHKRLKEAMGGLKDDSSLDDLEENLIQLMNVKKAAMSSANAAADDAYASLQDSLHEVGRKIHNPALEPSFKRAGLLSVNEYYPDVGKILATYVDEITAHKVKTASHTPLDITINHPWVKDAKYLDEQIQNTADLTLEANQASEAYVATCRMYENRDTIRKYASAGILGFLAGDALKPVSRIGGYIYGKEDPATGKKLRDQVLGDLDDPFHELNLRDIQLQRLISDFSSNDEILSSYAPEELIRGYNTLLHTAPGAMRDDTQARALLQQYMTQGRMAPSEIVPALQLNKLSPRRDTITRSKGKDDDGKV